MGKQIYQLYSSTTKREIDWLWYPYIPYGKITLLQGDPGDGKSTCMISLAASLSSGGVLPDGTQITSPVKVIYQCAEDNVSDTVKPRLEHAGADCHNIAFIDDDGDNLYIGDYRIEETIKKLNARLLILDPIQSFISQDADLQSASKIRSILNSLGKLAEKYNCAVVLIGHLTKAKGTKTLYRGLGSINIAAVARSVLMVSRDKSISEIRYLTQIKNSLAPEGCPYAFIMDPASGFQWLGKSRLSEDSCSGSSMKGKSKLDKAQELIRILLSEEDLPSKEVCAKLKRLEISERTARTAAKNLGVVAYRKRNVWYWKLTEGNNVGSVT